MKHYITLALLTATALSSCGPKEPTAAQKRAEWREQQMAQLENERRTVNVTDSLISALVPQINTATSKGFEYEKTEYDDLGCFRPEGMDPSQNVRRTYLRCAVDDYGRTQLIATYCGSKYYVVQQLRIEASDGTSVTTAVIPPNDGSNYSYDIDGAHYQSVTFSFAGKVTEGMTQDSTLLANADSDHGALAFMAQHLDDEQLTGYLIPKFGKETKVTLTADERRAFASTYELGQLLRENTRLQQEHKTASLKCQYLEQKLRPTPEVF